MPTYTTSTEVLKHLPASPPTTVTDYTAKDIADASAIVDSRVGGRFPLAYNSNTQKFPQITDSPATPAIVSLAAEYLAASFQHVRLAMHARSEVASIADILRERAEAILEEIRSGDIEIYISGSEVGSRVELEAVEDKYYEDEIDPKETFSRDDLDVHWP